MPNNSKFPRDFLWGASTAAHQVEGNNDNQWTQWEFGHAEKWAKEAPDKLKNLENYSSILSSISDPANYISGQGIEHYKLYKQDFDLLGQLNMNAYRFGVEWSRIEPSEGQWDIQAINHYKNYINELISREIEPILTIWHWTMPNWFTEKGGFENKANIKYFERFSAKITEELAENIKYIIILNEPNVYASHGYYLAIWPPGGKSVFRSFKVFYNLSLAHKAAYRTIKSLNPNLRIGIAAQLSDSHPIDNQLATKAVVRARNYIWNWWFLNRIIKQLDFIGLNYYFTEYYNWRQQPKNPDTPLNDMGWYMEPRGIYNLLIELNKRYHKPIIITENGLADGKDKYRKWWIKETLIAMQKAIEDGVKLVGYLHWSLLDNFEWNSGWWPKFGLVAVNRKYMKRTIKPSAKWFASEIKKYKNN